MATSPTSQYRSYLVTRQGEGRSLSDLRGKRVCYVDRTSTSGFLMPRAMLRKAGFDPNGFFSSVQFSGDHSRSLRDLLAGRCDVAAVYSNAYTAEPKERTSKTRVVMISPPLPPGVICASPKVHPKEARRLRDALLSFDVARYVARPVLSKALPITGFAPADARAFDRLARELDQAMTARPVRSP